MSQLEENTARDRTLSGSSEPDLEPHFEPIIKLPEVQISTNEENETVLVKLRARLYRFDTSNEDGPEWKERGTGEVKLLRHNENNSVRVVMRRDKTFKVCANHFITPWMELKPSVGSDKAFVYTVAADFADEQPKTECLAIKFGSVEIASLFKEKFNEARNIVLTKCELYITHSLSDTEENDEKKDGESSDSDDLESNEEDSEENLTKSTDKVAEPSLTKSTDKVVEKMADLNVSKDDK